MCCSLGQAVYIDEVTITFIPLDLERFSKL